MSQISVKPPVWFWVVAGAALLWNLVGVISFFSIVTMSADAIAAMPKAESALYEHMPLLTKIAFAVGVFGGVAGSVLLLLRNKIAAPVFIASLIGIVVQFSHWLFMTDAPTVYGGEAYLMPVMVTVIAAALIWFSKSAKNRGWIR